MYTSCCQGIMLPGAFQFLQERSISCILSHNSTLLPRDDEWWDISATRKGPSILRIFTHNKGSIFYKSSRVLLFFTGVSHVSTLIACSKYNTYMDHIYNSSVAWMDTRNSIWRPRARAFSSRLPEEEQAKDCSQAPKVGITCHIHTFICSTVVVDTC